MLSSITWSQYATTLAIMLSLYYVYIAYRYFRWEILAIAGIKRIDKTNTEIPVAELKNQFVDSSHSDFLPKENHNDTTTLQSFWDEANAYLSQMNPDAPKEEILFAIKIIIGKYPGLYSAEHKEELEAAISGLLNQYYPERFSGLDIQYLKG